MKKFCFFIGTDRHHDEVVIFRQAKTLKEAGYDVSFVVSDDEPDEYIQDIKIIGSGFTPKNYFDRIIKVPIYLKKKLKEIDADIYQTCSVDQIGTSMWLRKNRKKVLFHMREGHPYTLRGKSKLPSFIKELLINIMVFYMRPRLRKFNAVITITDDVKKYLEKWGIKRLYVQGNFPYINKNYTLSYEDYLNRDNNIIYFGSIYGISCQEHLLKALEKVNNVGYLLAGKFWGNELYYKKLASMPKWKDVEFIDGFKIEELPQLLSRATMSNVLRDFTKTNAPNGSLGIIKIFESMEAALPIICSDVPLYRKIMNEYKCGILVDPTNSDEIANAIKYLIEHKKEAYKMGQEGRRAVIEKYSWNALSKEYISIVNNILTSTVR